MTIYPLTDHEISYMALANEAYRIAGQYDAVRGVLDHLIALSEDPDRPFLESAIEYLNDYIRTYG